MQDLLNLILKNIVTNPDAIQIVASNEDDREIYTINVDPVDMGRVIGKNGKVIKAIRALAHVVAIRQGKRFRINLADEAGDNQHLEGEAEETATPSVETEASEVPEKEQTQDLDIQENKTIEEVSDVIDLSEDANSKEE